MYKQSDLGDVRFQPNSAGIDSGGAELSIIPNGGAVELWAGWKGAGHGLAGVFCATLCGRQSLSLHAQQPLTMGLSRPAPRPAQRHCVNRRVRVLRETVTPRSDSQASISNCVELLAAISSAELSMQWWAVGGFILNRDDEAKSDEVSIVRKRIASWL
jgi:hypothetical protein